MEPSKPAGVKVFGSAVLRVEPDVVSLHFGVGGHAAKPREAFHATQQAAQRVRAYLSKAGIKDVAGSHINLSQRYEYVNQRNVPAGYQANINFNVLLRDLKRLEEVLVGVVDAGADRIAAAEFQTSRLKEWRAEARRRAVAAAREKAENYCRAAGITLGPILTLDDVNPSVLRGSGEGHTTSEVSEDETGEIQALAPGSIVVGAAVSITFAIGAAAGAPAHS
jgi:uncharacterized protein YggE